MLASIKSHVKRILSPTWTDNFVDTTPAHGNKKVSIAKVGHQLFWGMLTGKRNLRDIETQSEIFGDRIPDTTMTGVLERLTIGTLPELIAKQIKQASADKELRPSGLPYNMVSIDGKNLFTLRGVVDDSGETESSTKRRIMALRATLVSSDIAQVLGQRMIPNKSAETTELIPFLKEQDALYGRTNLFEVVSVDAGMTHLKNADFMHEKGIIYVMALKGNQPALFRLAQKGTRNLKPVACTSDTHGGYEIVREISIADVRGKFKKWSHAAEFWKITQTKTHKVSKEVTQETRYYITNMPKGKASSKQKLHTVRRHWGIENDAFWTLDAIFDEDSSPFTSRAIEIVSLIRIMTFNIMARFRGRRLKSTRHRVLRWNDFIQYFQAAFILYFAKPLHPV
jgi:predicted transposase YbfD/YdcC